MRYFTSTKLYLTGALIMLKTQGIKKTWKHYGWKLVAGIFIYYLIRDTFLYIVIPGFLLTLR